MLAALVPVIWICLPGRWLATSFIGAYYFASLRDIVASTPAFFDDIRWPLVAGIGLWFLFSGMLTAAWWIVDVLGWRATKRAGVGAVAVIVFLILPPFGIIGGVNPILALGWIAPGAGWIGITMYLAALVAMPWTPAKVIPPAVLIAACVLLVSSRVVERDYLAQGPLAAANTKWGRLRTADQVADRLMDIGQEAKKQAKRGVKAIVYPETTVGPWQAGYKVVWDWEIKAVARRTGVEIAVGAEMPNSTGGWRNELLIERPTSTAAVSARQTLPITMYRPWSKDGFESSWSKSNVVELGGKRALILFCYEELLPGLYLYSMLADRPEVIVAVSNLWWGRGTGEPAIQKRHSESMSRLFGIPLLRAVND